MVRIARSLAPASSRTSKTMSVSGRVQQVSAFPAAFSLGWSARSWYSPYSSSPERRIPLHAPHAPLRHPYGRPMPCRSAASSTVSPAATSKAWPLGWRRTWWPESGDSGKGSEFYPKGPGYPPSARTAEFAFDEAAAGLAAHGDLGHKPRAGPEQQRERDEVGDDARVDQEEAREHGARAVGERGDREAPLREARREARHQREARLLDERHAGAGREHHPREDPPAERLAQPHEDHGFQEGETQ